MIKSSEIKAKFIFANQEIEKKKLLIIETAQSLESKYLETYEAFQQYQQTQKLKRKNLKERITSLNSEISNLNSLIREKDNQILVSDNNIIELKDRLFKSEKQVETLYEEIRINELNHIHELSKEKESNNQKSEIISNKIIQILDLQAEKKNLKNTITNRLNYFKKEISILKSSLFCTNLKSEEMLKSGLELISFYRSDFSAIIQNLEERERIKSTKISQSEEIISRNICEISKLNSILSEKETQLKNITFEFSQAKNHIQKLAEENKNLSSNYEVILISEKNLQTQLQTAISNANNEKANHDLHIKELKTKLLDLEHKLAFSSKELERLQQIESQLKQENEDLQRELSDSKSTFEYTETTLREEIENYKVFHFKNSDLETKFKAEMHSLEAEIIHLRQKLNESHAEIVLLKEEQKKSEEINAMRIKEIKDWKGNAFDGVSSKELEKLKDYDRLKRENLELKEKTLTLNSNLNKLNSDVSTLSKSVEMKTQENLDLKEFLEQLKSDTGRGSEITIQQRLQIKSLQEQVHQLEVEKMLKEETEIKLESENSELRKKNISLSELKSAMEVNGIQMEENYRRTISELQDNIEKYKDALSKVNMNVSYSMESSFSSKRTSLFK